MGKVRFYIVKCNKCGQNQQGFLYEKSLKNKYKKCVYCNNNISLQKYIIRIK